MTETRRRFHGELEQLEVDIQSMGELAEAAVAHAVEALVGRDERLAESVIEGDDAIDERYLSVESRTLQVLALQTPVAGDLRLMSALLHTNLHLERIGDQAVNVAKIYRSVRSLPTSATILAHLQEMGDVVRPMIRTAMEAFARRDLDLCLKLPEMDDPVDRLNLGMYKEVSALADDQPLLDWGLRMLLIARQLERVGDHSVDIGEQVGFLLTGEFREFTDASHPVHIGPDAG
jgi:phosphate transport system protein